MQRSTPIFVDLDGTLIRTDLLVESFICLLKHHPLQMFLLPFWMLQGKANLKHKIAERISLNPAVLPYHAELLGYLKVQRESGRQIYLATASASRYAEAVAEHLGIFECVLASGRDRNLSGHNKLQAICECCPGGFVYAGNDTVDEPIWAFAQAVILVNTPVAVAARVSLSKPVEAEFASPPATLATWLKAIRPHQWLKNLLVFLPLLPIATSANQYMLSMALLAFGSFCLCASSVYIFNDLSDLEVDRGHPRKLNRPFASGSLSPLSGLLMAPLLLLLAFALALWMPWRFAVVLGIYWFAATSYTYVLKRYALIDVITLAGLYTLRVLAGAAAIAVKPSFWILAFSMFIFFSLALAKRSAELHTMRELNRTAAMGRGYQVVDLLVIQMMGVASGYLAVLVMALYLNSQEILGRYTHVQLLWGVCPLLMLFVSRVWLKSARGEMTDDPLVFAVRDRMMRYLLVTSFGLILAALF